jgi:hypothetical protein
MNEDPTVSARRQPPFLTASEIGSYAFFPRAWYLRRCGVPVSRETETQMEAGSQAHRKIGHQTDVVRAARTVSKVLLVAIAVILVALLLLAIRGML